MKMSFAIALPPEDLRDFARWARLSEEAGFDMVLTGDSPALFREMYVGLTLIATNTTSCRMGSFSTNPVSRHPGVVASGFAALNELSGGRTILGMSTGDTGVSTIGLKPATQSQLEEYIHVLRDLWAKSSASYGGRTVRFMWSGQQVPIYLAAGGPRSLRMAGRIADGVFIATGILPEVIQDALGHLRTGAEEAGRRLEDIDVWWHVRGNLGPSAAEATDQALTSIAGIANHAFRFTLEGKSVPTELRDKIETLKRGYLTHEHGKIGPHTRNAQLVTELGLRDYLAERFGLLGTPEDWVKRIQHLARHGVRKIAVSGLVADKEKFLDTMGRQVIPAFRN